MKPFAFILTILTLLCSSVMAVDVVKSVLITYPPETPASVINQAKKAVIDAGGIITHEYTLIRGFAAKVGEKVLQTVSAWGKEYQVLIEMDEEVHAMGSL
ncbi:hypothetical protein VTJ83DRAFT_6449 [Remersonia thermophila]|uniref:Proteinase inhibitor, propeptide n=1 Tax=Remersonia thermophila TaxID=72144 RepID=A0ABR4D701_9PEZI